MTGLARTLVLTAQLLSAQAQTPHPAATTSTNGTVALATFSRAELHKKFHAVIALSGYGDIAGAILKPNGSRMCSFSGFVVGSCVVLQSCVGQFSQGC